MRRDRKIVIRVTEHERRQWETLAKNRGLTVSDLTRYAVQAYGNGSIGIAFYPGCQYANRHVPGRTCPACGGNARS